MRFNNSTQKPRSQLPRLLRFWLGQPAGQTRSLAPRVWGQSVGPNSSIPIAGAAHPLLTVYDHFHSVLELFYFTVKACGLSSRLALGRGNLELSIVFFFFVKAAIAPQKGKSTTNSCPRPSKKKSSRWGGKISRNVTRSSLDLHPSLRFALVLYTRRTSFFFLFPNSSFQGPTLWPHTLAPHFGPTLWPHFG